MDGPERSDRPRLGAFGCARLGIRIVQPLVTQVLDGWAHDDGAPSAMDGEQTRRFRALVRREAALWTKR